MLKSVFNFVAGEAVRNVTGIVAERVMDLAIRTGLQHVKQTVDIAAQAFNAVIFLALGLEGMKFSLDGLFDLDFVPADAQAVRILEKTPVPTAEAIIYDHAKKTAQPAMAEEMIALLKELARRVMEGSAPVAELMSMIDTVQRMGIDVMDVMAMGPLFHSPQATAEHAA